MEIVIVGGGAGGLELATRLGRKLGRKDKAKVTLVDCDPIHVWKPLLHEVATGVLDAGLDEVSYRAHARLHGFNFHLGTMTGIVREDKKLILAPIIDEHGREVVGERSIAYDYLILALGSISNDFGTEGVKEHCVFLDEVGHAEHFHQEMLNGFLRMNAYADREENFRVSIVGAGATGVELSAELFNAAKWLSYYGLPNIKPEKLKVTIIEASPHILSALPERIASTARAELEKLGVEIRLGTLVSAAEPEGLRTKDGELIPSDLMVWAAGIKAPDFLANIAGLETNRINQIIVRPSLQTTVDPNIFAIGDCCACPMKDGKNVPPRAQSAHQMASHVGDNILKKIKGKTVTDYEYRDYGSLVSLSRYSAVGSLMGGLNKGSMVIEGHLARVVYISLYRMHQIAIHGWLRTGLFLLSEKMGRVVRPRLKLH
ncbi:MAG: NAD(P)/FAD-dependent oxidoreductase [Pseudomonadota bacterium]